MADMFMVVGKLAREYHQATKHKVQDKPSYLKRQIKTSVPLLWTGFGWNYSTVHTTHNR